MTDMLPLWYLRIRIPGLPSTTNANGRKHWSVKAREARHWKRMVQLAVGKDRPQAPLRRAKLTLVRGSAASPDFDGLVSSFKHVIDALQECGIIENDKFENIGQPEYRWVKAPRGKGYIEVSVEELRSENV